MRKVKKLLVLIAATALMLPLLAGAADWRPGFRPVLQAERQQMRKGPDQSRRGQREFQRGEQRKQDERRSNRLTEEERRGLQQDLDRASREIYRRQPPR